MYHPRDQESLLLDHPRDQDTSVLDQVRARKLRLSRERARKPRLSRERARRSLLVPGAGQETTVGARSGPEVSRWCRRGAGRRCHGGAGVVQEECTREVVPGLGIPCLVYTAHPGYTSRTLRLRTDWCTATAPSREEEGGIGLRRVAGDRAGRGSGQLCPGSSRFLEESSRVARARVVKKGQTIR